MSNENFNECNVGSSTKERPVHKKRKQVWGNTTLNCNNKFRRWGRTVKWTVFIAYELNVFLFLSLLKRALSLSQRPLQASNTHTILNECDMDLHLPFLIVFLTSLKRNVVSKHFPSIYKHILYDFGRLFLIRRNIQVVSRERKNSDTC